MPKAISKVTKQIAKKRGGKKDALHEKSRDVKKIRAAAGREDKLTRHAAATLKGRQYYVDRLTVFEEAIGEDMKALSDDEFLQLITKYLGRLNPELTQERAERRKGRPTSKREETLSQLAETEGKEFATGLWVPEMRNQENLKKLKAWNRGWSAMSNIAFVRVSEDGRKKESSFPPRGLS